MSNIDRYACPEKAERMAQKAVKALHHISAALAAGVSADAQESLIHAVGELSDLLGDAAHLWGDKHE